MAKNLVIIIRLAVVFAFRISLSVNVLLRKTDLWASRNCTQSVYLSKLVSNILRQFELLLRLYLSRCFLPDNIFTTRESDWKLLVVLRDLFSKYLKLIIYALPTNASQTFYFIPFLQSGRITRCYQYYYRRRVCAATAICITVLRFCLYCLYARIFAVNLANIVISVEANN